MTTTIVYYNENEYGYNNSKLFHVLTPVEKKIFIETFNGGRVVISCASGSIDEYARIIVGCFEEESNFTKMLQRSTKKEEKIEEIILIFSGQLICVKKGKTVQDIVNAYKKTSIFGGKYSEVMA